MRSEPRIFSSRDLGDAEEVRVRLTDGLVHRVHCDYHDMTACYASLMIINKTKVEVDAVWATWVTDDMTSCIECLCENDKRSADIFNAGGNPCGEVAIGMGNVCGLSKLSLDV